MPHLHRFFVENLSALPGDTVVLPDEEAHHAIRVLRLKDQEQVALFDGKGTEWTGTFHPQDKKSASVLVQTQRTEPEPQAPLCLLVPQLLSDKTIDSILTDCTALGVTSFRLYRAARSERAPKGPERWRRTLVESCKQCGRLWLPELSVFPTLSEALEDQQWDKLFIADLESSEPPAATDIPAGRALIVGPEGDLTSDELTLLHAKGAVAVSLGPYTLRTELACSAGVVMIRAGR